MSKLKSKRACCSTSSSEEEGSQPQGKRRRRALTSYVLTTIKEDIKREIRLVVEETVRKVIKEESQHMISQLAKLLKRAPSRPIERIDGRNLQLQFKTRLSFPVYTGKQIEGERAAPIRIALIDANTGSVVESGPEASIKLDVIVLDGDFVKENSNDWTREEFENYQMREREGKAPLLIGDLQVTLKEGVGVLGKLRFTDNSSWTRSKTCMIGLKVAPGYCDGVRIREAMTEAFRVKEQRGELHEKHFPAKPEDEVWRLKKIAKGGSYHKRLVKERIFIVEDLLRQFVRDPRSLRMMLGGGMTDNKWHELIDHAKSCVQSTRLYVYSYDELMSHAVVFDMIGQLKGCIADGSFFSADSLSLELKLTPSNLDLTSVHCPPLHGLEQLNNLVRCAYNNWDCVKEFNSANYSMQNSVSGNFPAGALWGQQDRLDLTDCHLTCIHTPPSSEFPPGSSGMAAEGCNEPEVGGSVINRQNGNPNVVIGNRPMHSLNQVEVPVHHKSASTEPCPNPLTFHGCSTSNLHFHEGQGLMEKLPLISAQDDHETEALMSDGDIESLIRSLLEDNPNPIPPSRGTSRAAIVSWLMIKAIFRWGFFVRRIVTNKVRPTIEQLN